MQPDIGIQKKRFQIGGRFSAAGWYSQEPIASYPKVSKSLGDEDGLVGWLLTSFLKTLEDLFNVAHSFLLIARVVFTKSSQLHESLLVGNLFLVASRSEVDNGRARVIQDLCIEHLWNPVKWLTNTRDRFIKRTATFCVVQTLPTRANAWVAGTISIRIDPYFANDLLLQEIAEANTGAEVDTIS